MVTRFQAFEHFLLVGKYQERKEDGITAIEIELILCFDRLME
jgi:hypothetical protein